MRKIYLIATSFLLSTITIAQEMEMEHYATSYNGEIVYRESDDRASGDVIYENNFSLTSGVQIQNNGQGTWERVNSTPQQITNFMGSMSSSTASNGFYLFNGTKFLDLGDVENQDSRLILDTNIDCSAAPNITVKFEQRYRPFNFDKTFIDVSTDGGTTWPNSYEINDQYISNQQAIQNTVYLNIAGGGSSSVKIRFRWVSTSTDNRLGSGYGWMIDDVQVIESFKYDNQLTEAYTVMGNQLKLDYKLIPKGQLKPLSSWSKGCNNGSDTLRNNKFYASFTLNSNTDIISSNSSNLAPNTCDSIVVKDSLTLTNVGTYDIKYYKSSDSTEQVTINDTINDSIRILNEGTFYSRSHYSRVRGTFRNVSNSNGQPVGVGNQMEIQNDLVSYGGLLGIGNDTLIDGQVVYASIYKFSNNQYQELERSENIVLSKNNAGRFVELKWKDPVSLSAGDVIILFAHHNGSNQDLNADGRKDDVPFFLSQKTLNNSVYFLNSGGIGRLLNPQAVLIHLGISKLSIEDEKVILKNNTKIYPNPANDIATINYTLNADANVTIEVIDLAGKLIRTKNLGNLNAGEQNYILNISNLTEGMYIYNLKVDGEVLSNRFSVMKH